MIGHITQPSGPPASDGIGVRPLGWVLAIGASLSLWAALIALARTL